jgi:hypothetical protein
MTMAHIACDACKNSHFNDRIQPGLIYQSREEECEDAAVDGDDVGIFHQG